MKVIVRQEEQSLILTSHPHPYAMDDQNLGRDAGEHGSMQLLEAAPGQSDLEGCRKSQLD